MKCMIIMGLDVLRSKVWVLLLSELLRFIAMIVESEGNLKWIVEEKGWILIEVLKLIVEVVVIFYFINIVFLSFFLRSFWEL